MVSPAGFMPFEKMQDCIHTLENWGYTVVLGRTTQSDSQNYFSGTDKERLDDLQMMLDDKKIKAVFCARGGYGMSRIIDDLNFKKFRRAPKWIVGFSDITLLHLHIHTNYKIASLHAPMAAAFNDSEGNNGSILSLKEALTGRGAKYKGEPHPFNNYGKAKGELVGGNLTLLAHAVGTPSDVTTKGKILFLEDIGDYLYNIDRMLLQLKRSGKLAKLKGLLIGGFTENKDTERPFGKTVYELIYEQIQEYAYPICFNFPVSHSKENVALKIGGWYELDVRREDVLLCENRK